MKRKFKLYLCLLMFATAFAGKTEAQTEKKPANFLAKGKPAPANNFTGTVWVNMLVDTADGVNLSSGSVTFEPGARTNWHKHGPGQVLMVTEGTGYYQEKGEPVRTIRKGEVVVCKPGITHWHGATKTTRMTHIALVPDASNEGSTVWLEKVTDAEYPK